MLSALKTKRARAGLGLLVLLAFSGAAVAYFTTTGSGTANTQVGTNSTLAITPTITPASGGLVPGGTPASVSFAVNNPSSGNQYLATVSLASVTAYSDAAHTNNITGTTAGKCDTSQFTMTPVTENQDIGSGNTTLATNGSLVFRDSGGNQNACENAYLVANFTSN